MEQTTKEAMAPKRLKKGGKKPLIITGVVLAVLIAAYLGLCAWASSLDTFFRGYQINGVDVGGLTVAQAEEKLKETLPGQEIYIYDAAQPEEPVLSVTLSDLGLDSETILDTIGVSDCLSHDQRDTFFLTKGFHFLVGSFSDRWFQYDLSGDDSDAALDSLLEQLNQEPVDAAYELGDDSLSITKARDGRSIGKEDLRQALEHACGTPGTGGAQLHRAARPDPDRPGDLRRHLRRNEKRHLRRRDRHHRP